MARWIRFRGRKVIKHHGMIFPSYDHYIRYYDRYGWDRSSMRGIKRVERGMR